MNADASELFLKVKLIHPPVREQRVPRPRLTRRLDGAFAVPLTLVCAPAGYGKTTLLVDWVSSRIEPVAWLTLGSEENDAARFLNYFLLALQTASPALGHLAQTAVNIPGADTRESCLRLLVNELSDMVEPLAVVLDDYHRIESEEVHGMLAYLVEHLPPALHIIISSRVEPPVFLSRLRAKGQVLELRAVDLRFQPDEYEPFLNRVMALGLSVEECLALGEQTEGWVAGLQLAGLSLLGGEKNLDPARFGAGQHYIFDYLAEEVLRYQPKEMQTFLLNTSILDQLTGPLCDALVEPFPPYNTGDECLDALEHANLFAQALDGEHHWYRYHALFVSFLSDRLQRTAPELVPDLHRRAAIWLASQGAFPEAYQHAIAGKDLDLAVRMVEASAEELEKLGEFSLLAEWIAALPEEMVRTRPRLNLSRAWVALGRLDVLKSTSYLDMAEQNLGLEANPVLRGEILAARAFLAGLMDRSEETLAFTEQAVHLLPEEGHYLSGLLRLNVCIPMMMSGRLPDVTQKLEEAVYYSNLSKSPFITLIAIRFLGEAYLMVGRLSQAERVFRQALDFVNTQFGENSSLAGIAWMGLGEVCRQRNDFAQAEKYLESGIEQTTAWMSAIVLDGYIWLASLKQSKGDPTGAQSVIHRAYQISDARDHPLQDEWTLNIATLLLDIQQGYLDDALRWTRQAGLDVEGLTNLGDFCARLPLHFREMALYTLARLFLVLGRREKVPGALEKSEKILNTALPASEERGAYALLMEGLILLAQVEQALERPQAAQDCLHRALDLGAPERPVRIFLDEGEMLMNLLGERRSLDLPSDERVYLEMLWSVWQEEQSKQMSSPTGPDDPVIEPLSRREVEVLRALAEGRSNQEIAAGLVLSLNTVKKHVSTIMGKLNARNRTQAVQIARRLGLLN